MYYPQNLFPKVIRFFKLRQNMILFKQILSDGTKMRLKYTHMEPEALAKMDKISAVRELYIDRKKSVNLTVEMDDEKAWDLFNKFPEHVLPPLPHGYQWVRANDNYSIIRDRRSEECDISLLLYGPDKTNYINFLLQVNEITTYSFGHTKEANGPPDRDYPMTSADFRVPDYDYSSKKYKGHVRGHLIDHQDTILSKKSLSTQDDRNYVPEPPDYEWGLGFRRLKIAELRKQTGGGAYAQLNMYSEHSLITANGTTVPDDVRVYTYTKQQGYLAKEVYHVEFEENMYRAPGVGVLKHAADHFATSINAAPVVACYSPDHSDRALRLQGRSSAVKEANIGTNLAPSRFIYKDKLYSACDSGNNEFETAGRQLHAGIYAENDNKISLEYLDRALFFGGKLDSLDSKKPIFTKKEKKEGCTFFKTCRVLFEDDDKTDDLTDKFRQLCSNSK